MTKIPIIELPDEEIREAQELTKEDLLRKLAEGEPAKIARDLFTSPSRGNGSCI